MSAVYSLLLFLLIFSSEGMCSFESVLIKETSPHDAQDAAMHPKVHKYSEMNRNDHEGSSHGPTSVQPEVIIKSMSDRNYQYSDFDFGNLFEPFFQPFPPLFREEGKKPKVKTVVSLTEIIGPKHSRSDVISSPFGYRDAPLTDDFLDFHKLFGNFMPKCNVVKPVHPAVTKRFKDNLGDSTTNVTDACLTLFMPWRHHHSIKRDMNPLDCIIDQDGPTQDIDNDRMKTLFKYLPFIEGAIGGVMFVLVILFIASWKIKKPNSLWLNVPFIDKSQCFEKV